jgi:flagellar basal body rod protein FlgG
VLQTTTNLQFTADTKTWLFGGEDGILTLPAGGDIVDSTGTSVLGGGGASLGDFSITTRTIASTTQGNVILRALGPGGAPSAPPFEYDWTFTNGGRLQMPAGGDIVDSTGASVLESTAYTAAVPGNWNGTPPTTIQQAIDRIVAKLATEGIRP